MLYDSITEHKIKDSHEKTGRNTEKPEYNDESAELKIDQKPYRNNQSLMTSIT